MRVGVTFDLRSDYRAQGYGEEETAEFDAEETIAALCAALTGLGHDPVRIGGVKSLAKALVEGKRWDAVFNICEGLKGVAREAQVPALLEAFDIPYFFSDPLTLCLSLDKALAKRVVRDAGVPTADFALVEKESDIARVSLSFPLFLKPVAEGSGKGVGENSKVENSGELEHTARDLLARFRQPVLVEEFLPGREFTIGITGTGDTATVLGVAEIVPLANFIGQGYGFVNKEIWQDKVNLIPARDEAGRAAGDVALAAWRVLKCRDGGRVDVRQDRFGQPCFMEVNPLAGMRPGYSDLCFIADFEGLSYQQLIGKFVEAFLARQSVGLMPA